MTAQQLAQLLYPSEPLKTTYERVSKQLTRLKNESLLNSEDYGLGKPNLWSIKRHTINTEHGYTQPKHIHAFKYEHEKMCADVFVKLALTGKLYGWEEHKRLGKGFIPDRTAQFEDYTLYIEVEMGSRDRVTEKLNNYLTYYHQTHERFKVLFLVERMRDWKLPRAYSVKTFTEFFTNSFPDERNTEFEPSPTITDSSDDLVTET